MSEPTWVADPLALYRNAVQHPLAEIAFFETAHAHHAPGSGKGLGRDLEAAVDEASDNLPPIDDRLPDEDEADLNIDDDDLDDADLLECGFDDDMVFEDDDTFAAPSLLKTLREDFCGTAAVAAMFVLSDRSRQAFGIDIDDPTLTWANTHTAQELGPHKRQLQLIESDVLAYNGPKVDCICSLNFSTLIYHTQADLKTYFKHVLNGLNPGGVFVMDLFGGPGSTVAKTQKQTIQPDDLSLPPYIYQWEQRAHDPATGRIDCRIHFESQDGKHRIEDAFVYDWTLWSPQVLLSLLAEVGFDRPTLWSDPALGGRFVPNASVEGRDEFTCYLTAGKPG